MYKLFKDQDDEEPSSDDESEMFKLRHDASYPYQVLKKQRASRFGSSMMRPQKIRRAFEQNLVEFHDKFKNNEIIVLPNIRIRQMNPISHFDIITDSLHEPQKKAIPSYMKANINATKLYYKPSKDFFKEINTHYIENRRKDFVGIPVSEVLGSKFYKSCS